jgi:hypothetical protein
VSGDNDKQRHEGPSGPSVVVGVHRVSLFPPENLHGAHRWVVITEDAKGRWFRRICRVHEPKPEIGDAS